MDIETESEVGARLWIEHIESRNRRDAKGFDPDNPWRQSYIVPTDFRDARKRPQVRPTQGPTPCRFMKGDWY